MTPVMTLPNQLPIDMYAEILLAGKEKDFSKVPKLDEFVDCTTGDVKPGHIFFVEREWFVGKSKRSEQRKDWEREDFVQWNRFGQVRVCC